MLQHALQSYILLLHHENPTCCASSCWLPDMRHTCASSAQTEPTNFQTPAVCLPVPTAVRQMAP
jgi:hypothetical protein